MSGGVRGHGWRHGKLATVRDPHPGQRTPAQNLTPHPGRVGADPPSTIAFSRQAQPPLVSDPRCRVSLHQKASNEARTRADFRQFGRWALPLPLLWVEASANLNALLCQSCGRGSGNPTTVPPIAGTVCRRCLLQPRITIHTSSTETLAVVK